MVKKASSFEVFPVGKVGKSKSGLQLKIFKPFRSALKELDNFSHITVLWWCHLHDNEKDRKILECEKSYKKSPEKMGIFATRSPIRPNPIGITVVSIIKIDHDNGIIHIPYIDAEIDTPIIDLKPYHPSADRVKGVSVPKWCSLWPKWYEDSANFDWESEGI